MQPVMGVSAKQLKTVFANRVYRQPSVPIVKPQLLMKFLEWSVSLAVSLI